MRQQKSKPITPIKNYFVLLLFLGAKAQVCADKSRVVAVATSQQS
jgi:hypothetical protein